MIDAFEKHGAKLAIELSLYQLALGRDEIEKYVWPDPLPETLSNLLPETTNEI
tara:strand:- start:120 stop:278 length:159 start_codon:yes stop_codon:yes gene_type:complete